MLRWLWLSLVVVALDQVTKWAVSAELLLHQPEPVLPFFSLTLMHNEGAAFSFLSDQGGWQRWLFIGLAGLVSLGLVVWMARLRENERLVALAFALILGGALGNLIDRVVHGYVIDFLLLHYQQWHWPAFNLADSAITLGAALLVIDAVFLRRTAD
ncbi:MAG: signal peptidase II [Chromatiales bacterium]|jgi:signal peptidase II